MKDRLSPIGNENGAALAIAIFILAIVSLLGITATRTSTIEVQIAGNDYLYKRALYQADSGTEFSRELIEESILCPLGFNTSDIGDLTVIDKAFWHQQEAPQVDKEGNEFEDGESFLSDSDPDIRYPSSASGNTQTDVWAFGTSHFTPGSAIQMHAGYEGKGKSIAGGGSYILFEIWSQHHGEKNTEVTVMAQYRVTGGSGGSCKY